MTHLLDYKFKGNNWVYMGEGLAQMTPGCLSTPNYSDLLNYISQWHEEHSFDVISYCL